MGVIEPNGAMLMICGFMYGFLDGTLNTQLIAMIGIIFPSEKDSAGAFVVWNLVQCVMASISLIYSQYLALHYQTFINIVVMIISLATFLKLDLLVLERSRNSKDLKDYVKQLSE